jgi:hypothetical protein
MRRAQCSPHLFLDVTRAVFLRINPCGDAQQLPQISTGASSRFTRLIKEKNRNASRGDRNMLDAIQISLALWAMIVCGGVKAVQLLHYLF